MAEKMSEYELYMFIIDDVISKVHNAFLEDGKDETVLQDLKEMWQEKLIKSKVVEKDRYPSLSGISYLQDYSKMKSISPVPSPLPSSANVNSPLIRVRIQNPQQMSSRPITCTHLLAQKNIMPTNPASRQMIMVQNPLAPPTIIGQQVGLQAMGQNVIFQTQPGLLPQVVVGNHSPIENYPQLRAQVASPVQIISPGVRQTHPQQLFLPSPRVIQIHQPIQRLQQQLHQPIQRLQQQLHQPIQRLQQPQQQPTIHPTPNATLNNLLNIRLKSPMTGQIILATNQVQPQLTLANNVIRINNLAANQIAVQRLGANGATIINPCLMLPQTKRFKQFDGPASSEYMDENGDDDEDSVTDNQQESDSDSELRNEEDEEEVCLDDVNPPTLEDIDKAMDCDNLLVCLFTKVHKKKTKFKLNLKLGILSIGGKEKVFKEATGEMEVQSFYGPT